MPEKERKSRPHTASTKQPVKAKTTHTHLQPRSPATGEARRRDDREERQRFLIVCEGERTEPLYFQGFRVPDLPVGSGRCTISLVEEAIRLRDEKAEGHYDQCWVVFDKDDFPAEDFHEAIRLAERNGFKAAYTNQAFELWYLLHFEPHEAAYDRRQYERMLTKRIGRPYEKNDPTMYITLLTKQQAAIKYAKRLMENYDPHNPADDNPCTTVHQLVEELRKNMPG